MDRSKRTALVVGIAVMLAAVASLGMYRVVSRMPARTAEVKTVNVVVAAAPASPGYAHHTGSRQDREVASGFAVAGTFTKVEDVVDRGLIAPVEPNEPLTQTKLAALEAGAGLPPSIPPGMRAISVKVNEVVGVAGFVVPGTRVDLMVTLASRNQQAEGSITRVVVSNVQVLTAGTKYDQENAKEGTPIPSTVVTLLVTPEDGERIALAASEGQIMLALRNPLDTATTTTIGIRTAGLVGGQPAATSASAKPRAARVPAKPVQAEPAPASVSKTYSVEAIRGAKRSEEIVR